VRFALLQRLFSHLPPDLSAEAYQAEYSRIITSRYDGQMGNLPRELWYDIIFTAVKGPRVLPFMVSTKYRRALDADRVEVIETTETGGGYSGAEIYILPDWWESSRAVQ
jgi:hypothetical protein